MEVWVYIAVGRAMDGELVLKNRLIWPFVAHEKIFRVLSW